MQSLWIEVKNLKEIIYQSCDAVETSVDDDHKSGAVTAIGAKRGKRAITQARNFSQLYYDENSNIDGRMVSATNKSSITDDFYSLKSFSLDLLTQHLHFIQDVFQHEKNMLERKIEQLLTRLDSDINSKLDMEGMQLSSLDAATSRVQDYKGNEKPEKNSHKNIPIDISTVDLCSVCKANSVGKKKDKSNHLLGNKMDKGSVVSMCASCQLTKTKLINSKSDIFLSRHDETHSTIADAKMSKLKQKTCKGGSDVKRAIESSLEFVHVLNIGSSSNSRSDLCNSTASDSSFHNNNEDSPGSLTPSRSGRFRSRLNSARSELHFLEDF